LVSVLRISTHLSWVISVRDHELDPHVRRAGNSCLTATQKLVPKKVFAFHKRELEELMPKGRRG